ncbi:MAG: hypothetical protein FJ315_04140, partial [SAR202 cluster bacterium]|nr:hypothetical protein [SAR202 cluster bacterium]
MDPSQQRAANAGCPRPCHGRARAGVCWNAWRRRVLLLDSGLHWRPLEAGLTSRDVRALVVDQEGTLFAATRGGGVWRCAGGESRWQPLETGGSNDVRCLAVLKGSLFAGADDTALLTLITSAEFVELKQQSLFHLSGDFQPSLEQRALTPEIVTAFKEQGKELPDDAVASVQEPGARWAIAAGDAWYSIRSESGVLSVYQGVNPLVIVRAPGTAPDSPGARLWTLGTDQGQQGLLPALDGELMMLPAASDAALVSEIAEAGTVTVHASEGYTTIGLSTPLNNVFDAGSVTVNASVVHATHGETIANEVLGSGQGSQPNQSFVLQKAPLTYLAAPTGTGSESTVEARVVSVPPQGVIPGVALLAVAEPQGLVWREVSGLFSSGPQDRVFTVRTDDEGRATVSFGDGSHGARLPSGNENIVAKYRPGIGPDGEMGPGRLTMMPRRPLGVRSVTNPVPSTGAAPRESLDLSRRIAPLKTRALARVVSLDDYEDFLRSLSGIGKAQARPLWTGRARVVHLTVAASDGEPMARESSLFQDALGAIRQNRASQQPFWLDPCEMLRFNVEATVFLAGGYQASDVEAAASAALEEALAFEERLLAQDAAASDVITVLQSIPGVVNVELTALYITGLAPSLHRDLAALQARWDPHDQQP